MKAVCAFVFRGDLVPVLVHAGSSSDLLTQAKEQITRCFAEVRRQFENLESFYPIHSKFNVSPHHPSRLFPNDAFVDGQRHPVPVSLAQVWLSTPDSVGSPLGKAKVSYPQEFEKTPNNQIHKYCTVQHPIDWQVVFWIFTQSSTCNLPRTHQRATKTGDCIFTDLTIFRLHSKGWNTHRYLQTQTECSTSC